MAARPLSADEQQAWRAFLGATKHVFEQLDRQLQHDAGMPLAYYDILVLLSEAPDRTLRMSELARRSRSSRSRLSHAVDRLEQAGWVARERCPTDRRGYFATLTDEGFAQLTAAAPGHIAAVRSVLFDPLSPAQVASLRAICERVLDQAGEQPPAPGSAATTLPAVGE